MGACRGLNLILGIGPSIYLLEGAIFLALVPVCYIAGITLLSRGEVFGGERQNATVSLGLISAAFLGLLSLGWSDRFNFFSFLPFFLFLTIRVYPPFWRAFLNPRPELIRTAVGAGVLSLILLNAAIAGGYGGFFYGLGISLLLPLTVQMKEWVT